MPGSQKKAKAATASRHRVAAGDATPALVRDLAWSGDHAEAIGLATRALATAKLGISDRLDILDLRAESYVAVGDLARAGDDATAMLELARDAKKPAFVARALNRRALVETRSGRSRDAIGTAEEALQAARRGKRSALEAMSLFRLAEAQFRQRNNEQAARTATQAARLFKSLGDTVGQGRALWAVSVARSGQGRVAVADQAAAEALALARRGGDLYGAGNAINLLTFHEADIAARMRKLQQSMAAFAAAGYVERQGVVTHNLGNVYHELGLYRRARRLLLQASEIYRRSGRHGGGLATTLWVLAITEHAMGHPAPARAYLEEAVVMWEAGGDARSDCYRPLGFGRIALWEGDPATAVTLFEEGARILRDSDQDAAEILALVGLSEAHLAVGNAVAALAATERATAIHRAHDLAEVEGLSATALWWRHHESLRANGKTAAARRALVLAYRFLVKPIAALTDEGLRRNYLNKVDDHRKIVAAWLADASKCKVAPRRYAHLTGKSSLREPFERLVDTGLRLNELRSGTELHEFLIDEATELSGAQRVLLILETPTGLQLAGSLVPQGEEAQRLLQDIAPALDAVRRGRTVSLAHEPVAARELAQRSRIVAPLVAQRELLGYLYADIDGAYGRFHDADRDLLVMLASQAAVALANAQWSQGLEQKVARRTEELQASNAQIEARATELAVINSIQQGMASAMTFQGIVDLVGDKLREVFRTGDLSIRWWDDKTDLIHQLYLFEHGVRLDMPPTPRKPGSAADRLLRDRTIGVANTRAEQVAQGITGPAPGTDWCLSIVGVPIIGIARVLGAIVLEDHEREHAFGEAQIRLLSTIAASMGVALENARLFEETQRLLKETERRSSELAVINSIQHGMAKELNFQAIVDLVGDKLRALSPPATWRSTGATRRPTSSMTCTSTSTASDCLRARRSTSPKPRSTRRCRPASRWCWATAPTWTPSASRPWREPTKACRAFSCR